MLPISTYSGISCSTLNSLGSGGWQFAICPKFCSRRKFLRIFRALVAGCSLYARDFVTGCSFSEFSGHWQLALSYMPEILLLAVVFQNFPGTGGWQFTICPGFYSRRKFLRIFRALATGNFLYSRDFVPGGCFS